MGSASAQFFVFFTIIVNVFANNVEDSFMSQGIVQDVIPRAPKETIYVKYPGGVVNNGNELTPSTAASQPDVSWVASPSALYTLAMVDPDAPSRTNPIRRNWLHWLVGNIPGKDLGKGTVMAAYNKPSPPKGSGPHRYVFLLFKQNGRISFSELWTEKDKSKRGGFSMTSFASKYSLGDPIAGNFFQAATE